DVGGVNFVGLLYLGLVLFIVFGPILLSRRSSSPGGSGEDDPGGSDDGPPPPPPPKPRLPPPGGVQLDDAEPARVRLRDHRRLADARRPPGRRPAQEPDRTRVR